MKEQDTSLIERARAWHDQDPDPETRDELDALIAAAQTGGASALAELHSRFDDRLAFGTAGLRGELAAGPNRMNRVLVAQAAAGLAAYLLERSRDASVVIGYDGRKNSRVFAVDTAQLMAGAGVRAILLPRLLPTPVLAFAVRHLRASAGVMVTASHNPPRDNGYKVYLGGDDNGSQIVSPADSEIATQIARVAEHSITDLPRSDDYTIAGEEVVDEYVRATVSRIPRPTAPLRFVYTAMHGVGWEVAKRVFADCGFEPPIPVLEQLQPDPDFPTVAFPNPEEPGALDLSFATASANAAELIIANDPDADRLAVAVPNGSGWRRLSGNDVGALLGWRAAERMARERDAKPATGRPGRPDEHGVLAASIVSSPALAEVARHYGLQYRDTLTGFKWVSRVPGLAYGYEEALGYLVDPDKVRDKDGISAAAEFLALAAELKAAGKTIDDHLLEFADRFGAFASGQVSVRLQNTADIPRIMARLRSAPPDAIGAVAVRAIDDFQAGIEGFPPSDILRLWLTDGSRVIVRPSGTEPKVKVYLDASSTDGDAAERRSHAQATIDALAAAVRPLLES